jgi:tetratricopeptide (TPR) repeat protein/serine/threonine protein kinase
MGLNYRVGDEPVPGYRLERFLGRGAIGEVWQATGPGGTEAALKIIDLAGGGVHGQKEFRALQLVKRIHHPNLTPIMGLWAKSEDGSLLDDSDTVQIGLAQATKDTGRVHQTMVAPVAPVEPIGRRPTELIIAMGLGRHSLFDRLRECREQGLDGIPVAELLDYFEAAAKAIDFLNSPVHELATGKGAIVHCDIKPLNILVVGGAAQVCDFGLAHMVGKARSTAATMGTIAYIAPEMLQGAQPTPATDQYSLAISYFELRTGSLPYREETVAAVMKAVVDGDLDLSRLPKPEQAVLRKAAAPDPRDRYGSASEMVAALRRSALGEPAVERRAGFRIPGWLMIAAVLLVALVVGVWMAKKARGPDGSGGPPAATIEEVLKEADEHSTRGDFRAAVADYDAVLERDPQSVAALVGRGKCRLELQDLEKAVADLEQARSLQPDLPDVPGLLVRAYTAMAEEHERKDELTPAIADYTAVLRLEPQNLAALAARGSLHAKLNDHEPAIADLVQAIDAGRADDQLKRLLADAYLGHAQKQLARHEWKEARQTSDAAIGRFPKDARLVVQRGRALLGLGQTSEALADVNQALQIDGANVEARFLRSTILLKNKQYAEAVADFEKVAKQIRQTTPASELRPFGEAYLALGTKLRDDDRLDEAIKQFSEGVQYEPDNPLLWSRLGTSQLRRDKFEDAAKSLTEAIQRGTEDVDLDLVYRGRAYRNLASSLTGDPAQANTYVVKAKNDLIEATKRNPNNGDAYFLLGETCLKLGQYDDAIMAYTKAIEHHDPSKWQWCDLKEAHFFRGNCYILTDRLDEAAKEFSLLADKLGWPDLPPAAISTALHGLAAKYAQKQQFAEAAKWNSKGIERAPDEATKEKYRKQQKLWESPKPK